jgi:predicted lipoprotein with Yx(FWY)xxD motif
VKCFKLLTPALASLALLSACATVAHVPAKGDGDILVGPSGMTLYTFDKDDAGSGKSNCNGACATNWPPLFATDQDKPTDGYAVITRDDGKKQWTLRGKPLYYWAKDVKPGDKTGDGFNKAWQIARP